MYNESSSVKSGYTYRQLLDVSRKIGSEVARIIGDKKAVLVYMNKGVKTLRHFLEQHMAVDFVKIST